MKYARWWRAAYAVRNSANGDFLWISTRRLTMSGWPEEVQARIQARPAVGEYQVGRILGTQTPGAVQFASKGTVQKRSVY
jgi:hypothetical protein